MFRQADIDIGTHNNSPTGSPIRGRMVGCLESCKDVSCIFVWDPKQLAGSVFVGVKQSCASVQWKTELCYAIYQTVFINMYFAPTCVKKNSNKTKEIKKQWSIAIKKTYTVSYKLYNPIKCYQSV